MALTEYEWHEIHRALEQWVKVAPDDVPVLGFLQGTDLLTPPQLLKAVDDPENADGTAVKEMLEHAVKRTDIQTVVGQIYRATERHLEHG